jgi:hypothetical protein
VAVEALVDHLVVDISVVDISVAEVLQVVEALQEVSNKKEL